MLEDVFEPVRRLFSSDFPCEAGNTEFKNEAGTIKTVQDTAGDEIKTESNAVRRKASSPMRMDLLTTLTKHPGLPVLCMIRPGTVEYTNAFTPAKIAQVLTGRYILIGGEVSIYNPFDSDAMFDVLSEYKAPGAIADMSAADICKEYSDLPWTEAVIIELEAPEADSV